MNSVPQTSLKFILRANSGALTAWEEGLSEKSPVSFHLMGTGSITGSPEYLFI